MKYFLLIWMLCPLASLHAAGPGIRIACYNAESLHDTIPDRLIDDGDYTPRGARQWNGERYRLKIGHIARVIDELDADLLLLTEIENESVLRDLMLATSSDYNYIHRHTSDRRGMDIALLYRGSLFFPGARPSDRRAGTSPRAARRRRTARRRTADADRHPPALATEPRFVSASGARNAPESRRFDLAPRSRPQIAGNGRHELHAPIGGGRPGTGHTRSGRHRPRGNVQTRSALHPAARAEPPKLRQLRLPRQALPIRLDRGKSGRDARSRTAAKSRRSLRARLDASFLRPVQRVSAAHFSLARIPRRLQRPSRPYTSSWKHRNRNKAETGRQRAEPLACSKKKTYFCGLSNDP